MDVFKIDGAKIRELREAKNLTREELSELSGVPADKNSMNIKLTLIYILVLFSVCGCASSKYYLKKEVMEKMTKATEPGTNKTEFIEAWGNPTLSQQNAFDFEGFFERGTFACYAKFNEYNQLSMFQVDHKRQSELEAERNRKEIAGRHASCYVFSGYVRGCKSDTNPKSNQ